MPHKSQEARNEYMRDYKVRRRADPAFKERERERERERYAERNEQTRDQRLSKNARYREKNREHLAAKERERSMRIKTANPEAFTEASRARARAWRESHRDDEQIKEANRVRSRRNYQKVKSCEDFKASNRAKAKNWYEKNTERAQESARKRWAERYKSDIQFKLGLCLRRRLYMAVRNNHRSGLAVRELGCSIAELKEHLERQFADGMTWGNWGRDGWHIDHVRPLASFDLEDPEQVKAACHFTNLQPLWSKDNIRKGNTFVE
ncbi:hypothetical protein KDH83_29380 [Achromobacter sp. Marseille-Q0513]|uniref:hypothetical protein n=1 Tax=Achromobacter sp. Marseille-Q0513 TaxID=2829161 RepID=UPI001B958ECF|nr:hypothetical protein [Achromobacter sp. Marseille-Q0513]MBR8657434.1 hypothetical protein [Achromobacter sp. Marseille-Q0513]